MNLPKRALTLVAALALPAATAGCVKAPSINVKEGVGGSVSHQSPDGSKTDVNFFMGTETQIGPKQKQREVLAAGTTQTTRIRCSFRAHLPGSDGTVSPQAAQVRLSVQGPIGGRSDAACPTRMAVEVPDDAHFFRITADPEDGSAAAPPAIAVVDSIAVRPGVQMAAEPGTKLVLIGPLTATGWVDVRLKFRVDSLREIVTKPLLLGTVTCGDAVYYPPLVPAVTDLADAPPMVIPVSDTLVPPDLTPFAGSSSVSITCP
jgi:hypothetical protein